MASLADNDGAGQIGAQLLTKKKLPPSIRRSVDVLG